MVKNPLQASAAAFSSGMPRPTLRVVRLVTKGVDHAGQHIGIHAGAVIFHDHAQPVG
jgi:hypothetical protein